MAGTPRPGTPVETERADRADAAPLTPEEQSQIRENDPSDTAAKAEEPKLTGKRVRAIPAVITKNGDRGTTIEVRDVDFNNHGIKHPTVTFDARHDHFTVAVGEAGSRGLSEEAAKLLTSKWPNSFEYMDDSK